MHIANICGTYKSTIPERANMHTVHVILYNPKKREGERTELRSDFMHLYFYTIPEDMPITNTCGNYKLTIQHAERKRERERKLSLTER